MGAKATVIGETVSHYRVDRRLGEGGMAVVYAAEDLRLGRQVALKFLRDEAGGDEAGLDRFLGEARAASALNNPHICTVHDVGRHEGRPFIVMELLEGTTLADRLKEAPLPGGELLDLAVQLGGALSAAHAKGIVHRDLKPGNIFVTDSGLLKVLDFGVAKLQREPTGLTTSVHGLQAALIGSDGGGSTASGLVPGTPPYMSPEQARGREVDARSDLFSLGAVLYEMATGRRAFTGGSPNEVIDAVLNDAPLPPSRLRPDLPRGLDAVVLRALEKHRDARYQSATEMLECLRSLQAESRQTTGAPEDELTGWRQPATGPRRGRGSGPIRSLAVLPLHALSSDAEQELLADGMTDALIAHLSGIRAVRVISRTSVL
ncbi:MAG TPA: serine/threonine-protein kinase, partial [Vicinamibacteria bacterium]|nr:serine/threonine-protein kinase [Vicinamibacteria bacterium]